MPECNTASCRYGQKECMGVITAAPARSWANDAKTGSKSRFGALLHDVELPPAARASARQGLHSVSAWATR